MAAIQLSEPTRFHGGGGGGGGGYYFTTLEHKVSSL
jgi:hypothetical protein